MYVDLVSVDRRSQSDRKENAEMPWAMEVTPRLL
jgi:hypothetical protein